MNNCPIGIQLLTSEPWLHGNSLTTVGVCGVPVRILSRFAFSHKGPIDSFG